MSLDGKLRIVRRPELAEMASSESWRIGRACLCSQGCLLTALRVQAVMCACIAVLAFALCPCRPLGCLKQSEAHGTQCSKYSSCRNSRELVSGMAYCHVACSILQYDPLLQLYITLPHFLEERNGLTAVVCP
jgi:hypothetical protein